MLPQVKTAFYTNYQLLVRRDKRCGKEEKKKHLGGG